MKKRICIIFVVVLLLVYSTNVLAVQKIPEETRWTNIGSIVDTFYFNGKTGQAVITVVGNPRTEYISMRLTIYKLRSDGMWTFVSQTTGGDSAEDYIMIFNFAASQGSSYKAVANVTVRINGVNETETATFYHTYE